MNGTGVCSSSSGHRRFQEWLAAGVFEEFWRPGLLSLEAFDEIDWSWLAMDGAMMKAPLGAEKAGPNPTDRGKAGVKRSLLSQGNGIPVAIMVDGANRHDMKLARRPLEALKGGRPLPTATQTQGLYLDKGYDYDEVRELVGEFGSTAHVCAHGEDAQKINRKPVSVLATGSWNARIAG